MIGRGRRGCGVGAALAVALSSATIGMMCLLQDGFRVANMPLLGPKSSRMLAGSSVDSSEPLVYRDYQEDFDLDLYGLTELLADDDLFLLTRATESYLNVHLTFSPIELLAYDVRALGQHKVMDEAVPLVSVSVRIMGQAVSPDAREVAKLSFQEVVLGVFSENASGFTRALKKTSDTFYNLLVPRVSLTETDYSRVHSSDDNLVVLVSAAAGATIMTALVLCICVCRQKQDSSAAVGDKLEKDDMDDLGIASTWSSSSDEPSNDEAPISPPITPPRMKSFPVVHPKLILSPCIEEGSALDLNEELDSSDDSSQGGCIQSLSNWTYSSSSSSGDSGDSAQISLSMQSIDEFEASIRSTPPRKRQRALLEI